MVLIIIAEHFYPEVSFMLIVTFAECHYAECCYTECHYAECHYDECHGTNILALWDELG
jgi:hypothetical protein